MFSPHHFSTWYQCIKCSIFILILLMMEIANIVVILSSFWMQGLMPKLQIYSCFEVIERSWSNWPWLKSAVMHLLLVRSSYFTPYKYIPNCYLISFLNLHIRPILRLSKLSTFWGLSPEPCWVYNPEFASYVIFLALFKALCDSELLNLKNPWRRLILPLGTLLQAWGSNKGRSMLRLTLARHPAWLPL